jgi:hypothetical protein
MVIITIIINVSSMNLFLPTSLSHGFWLPSPTRRGVGGEVTKGLVELTLIIRVAVTIMVNNIKNKAAYVY